jgi:GTP cyclohydrolase II
VKSTRRKVFHRASNAAMDDAIPTFSNRVNSRSRTDVAVSIFGCASQAKASQSAARCKAGIIGCGPRIKWRAWNQPLATRAEIGAKLSPCYTSRFPMRAKSQRGKKLNRKASGLEMVAHAALPTRYGRFTIYGFRGHGPQEEAVALVRGKLNGKTAPLVRVHSQCLTGDVLASLRCDCRAQLELSLKQIGQAPSGILLYLPQEGRGIGLMNKLRAYELQDGGMDTVEANETLGFAADARDYEFPAQILKKLGATKIRLLSNNPEKVRQLESSGIRVVERVPCQPRVSRISRAYLKTKKRKMGHLLEGI